MKAANVFCAQLMEREQIVQIICYHSTFMNPQQPQPIWASLVETFNECSSYATIMQSHSADAR